MLCYVMLCTSGVRETTKKLRSHNPLSGRDSKKGSSEYEGGLLTTTLRRSVIMGPFPGVNQPQHRSGHFPVSSIEVTLG
jgi:hypothetical protein